MSFVAALIFSGDENSVVSTCDEFDAALEEDDADLIEKFVVDFRLFKSEVAFCFLILFLEIIGVFN